MIIIIDCDFIEWKSFFDNFHHSLIWSLKENMFQIHHFPFPDI